MMFQYVLEEKFKEHQSGFTLLEILVALVIGAIFITAICALIIDQTQTHEDHQMKVMMQQNGRAALSILTNELMLAGYAPMSRNDGGSGRLASVETAGIDVIKVTFDRNGNGRIKRLINHNDGNTSTDYIEQTIYSFDGGTRKLERNNSTNAFLENVEAFRVLYGFGIGKYGVLEKDGNKTIWAFDTSNAKDGNGHFIGDKELDHYYTIDDDGTLNGPYDQISISVDRIRAVKIWLLMRSNKRKNKNQAEMGLDPIPYKTAPLDPTTLDNDYSYRLYTTTIKLRNMNY